jgi:diguanylate cyclase (GGDEF)-like protein
MRGESLIALKLGRRAAATDPPELLPGMERALSLVRDVLPAIQDEMERRQLAGDIDALRTALEADDAAVRLEALAGSCLDLFERTVQALRSQHAEHRAELRAMVALVRDTTRLLAAGGDAFSADVTRAASRFHSLLRIDDVQQLKERLVAEVKGLHSVAADRQKQWKTSIAAFEERIVTLEQQLSAVRQEASHDSLTGIFNRRYFEQRVAQALAAPGRSFALAVIDLDDFKAINDRGGHAAGDRVLQAVASALRDSVRRHDVVARVGGDEFAVLASSVTLRDAELRVRDLVSALSRIPTGLEAPSHVSVSCGLAEYCAGDTVESVSRRADQALYEAKRQGKRRVVVKSPPFIRDLRASG